MNRLLKKRMLIISISLAFLLLINIGVSYSYYLGKVVGNESDTTLSLKSAGIIVQYENNSGNIEASNIMPGWNTTKSFSVSSTILETDFTNDQTKLWYEIILHIDQNDFPTDILTYTLKPSETVVGSGVAAESRTNAGIETGTNENGVSLGLGYFTVGSNKHDYSITFNYVDNGSEYSNYPDSNFLVHIGVKVVVSSSIIIDLDGGAIEGSTVKYVSKGGTVVLPIPTKDGYIFDGWAIMSGDGVVDGNNVTVNEEVLNISAVWRSKSISSVLVLDLDGGTTTQDTINDIKTGEIQTLEDPTRPGYIFRGWELVKGDAEISGNKLVAYDESVKIIAIWEYAVPDFTYLKSDGTAANYLLINDTPDNWRIKFLESGTLTITRLGNAESGIDVFLVGGGGAGNSTYGSGGGGGYTKTVKKVFVNLSTNYSIVVGAGGTGGNRRTGGTGGNSSAFDYIVSGGFGGSIQRGGNGGSGGGSVNANGGSDGNNGGSGGYVGGTGQGTTTREFGETAGNLYAGGGGGESGKGGSGGGANGSYNTTAPSADANTGGGGGGVNGDYSAGSGGSGIVIIRNARG